MGLNLYRKCFSIDSPVTENGQETGEEKGVWRQKSCEALLRHWEGSSGLHSVLSLSSKIWATGDHTSLELPSGRLRTYSNIN